MKPGKHFDTWSLLVIAITFILFVLALFFKGLTHDLLLEAGVFLVSVKLILMGYKISITNESIQKKLDALHSAVMQSAHANTPDGTQPSAQRPGSCGESSGMPDQTDA